MAIRIMRLGIICLTLIICLLSSGCGGNADTDVKDERKETMSIDRDNLLTEEEFFELSNISKEDWEDVDIATFIEDFEITEESIRSLNVELLLNDYRAISEMKDVSPIFDDAELKRTKDFTEDASAIAFYENINTGYKCVYYDLEENCKYSSAEGFLFRDLNQGTKESFSDGDSLLQKLNDYNVFQWKSGSGAEEIQDPQNMVLVIKYDDGSKFKVSATGILSKMLPKEYREVRTLLFGESF